EQVQGQDLAELLAVDLRDRAERAEEGGVEHEHVERLPAPGNGDGELADPVLRGKVERGDRRRAAGRMDPLLDLLQAFRGPGGEDHMRAAGAQRLGDRGTEPPAGASDQSEFSVKGSSHCAFRHAELVSASMSMTVADARRWTLKQVQGDDLGARLDLQARC